ncbi:MAG: rhodanese-like domain-containing protein [Chromatiales bacterium]|nr:rhodanese-like domain-containing protein [Chromatiales bacterium]
MLFRNFRLTILVLAAGLLGACADPPPYVNVDSTGLEQLVAQGVVLYDIRRPEEWRQTGVVAGSELLTFADASGRVRPEFFDRFQREVPRDRPVALICRTGNRTDVLGRYLMDQLGYKQVFNVRDGITAWMREGHPVHKP